MIKLFSMQGSKFLLVLGLSISCMSCGSIDSALDKINQPLDGDSELDPLDLISNTSSRRKVKKIAADATGEAFNAGDYVETAVPNTPFFKRYPTTGATHSKVLAQGLVLRVIAAEGSYLKVQNEEGEEGYVANVMVVPQGLLTGGAPLPDLPPVRPGEVPTVEGLAPEPEIPSIEAPIPVDPTVPVAPPIPEDPNVPSPVAPSVEPTPVVPKVEVPKVEEPAIAPEPEIPGIE